MSDDDLIDVRTAAEELGVKVRTVQYRIARGHIKAQRVGSQFVITRAELDRAKADPPRIGRPAAS